MSAAPSVATTAHRDFSVLRWLRAHLASLLIGFVLVFIYFNLFAFKGYFEIGLQTFVGNGAWFKVYWAGSDQSFSEENSARVRIRGGDYQLKIFVDSMGGIDKLRIDPIDYRGRSLIKYVQLSQRGYRTIRYGPEQLGALRPANEIAEVNLEQGGLSVITDGHDGYLELDIDPQRDGSFSWIHFVNAALILLASVGLSGSVRSLEKNQSYVIFGLTIAVFLAVVMASLSAVHTHPDERVHLEAVQYYRNHVMPPSLDSPEIVGSFSDYGKSRLSTYESYYPIAGWFTRMLSPLKASPVLNARAFGVLLLAVLLFLAVAKPGFRYFALPLILTPQLWYLYSYPNSDVFALTLCLVAGYQFASRDSALNRLLTEQKPRWFVPGILLFGVLAGLLLLSKVNFYFFLLFLGLYVVWRQLSGDFERPSRVWIRLLLIGAVGMAMYGGRVVQDYVVNGPDPKARFNEYIELHAKDEFKPSTPLQEKHRYLYLRQRGNSLDVVMQALEWGGITFATAFGSYGYTQYFGTDGYFNTMALLFTLLTGSMVIYGLIRGPTRVHGLILLAAGCAGLLVAASIWSSWNENFQAQGRYMAPIVPMIAMVYYHLRDYVNPRVICILALMMLSMSVYSFLFIGLDHIGKASLYLALP